VPAPFAGPDEDVNADDPANDEVRSDEQFNPPFGGPGFGTGGRNVVMIRNHSDGHMRVRGRIRLVQIDGPNAAPLNGAFVFAACTDCQSFGVALEIVLVSPTTTNVAPVNRAIAHNDYCTRCVTVARALQYVYTVDDPHDVPANVRRLLSEMEREIRDVGRDRDIGAGDANARINGVIAQFTDLATSLNDQADQTEDVTSPDTPSAPAAAPGGPADATPTPVMPAPTKVGTS
jgi:hypothetical protein